MGVILVICCVIEGHLKHETGRLHQYEAGLSSINTTIYYTHLVDYRYIHKPQLALWDFPLLTRPVTKPEMMSSLLSGQSVVQQLLSCQLPEMYLIINFTCA